MAPRGDAGGYDLEPDEDECPNCGAILGDYEGFEELDE